MLQPRLPLHPLAVSLSRFRSAKAIGMALALAAPVAAKAANVTWEGTTGATPGDGFLWTNRLNWMGDVLPSTDPLALDDLTFGLGTPGIISLNGDQIANSIKFNQNFVLGAYGTNEALTLDFGTVDGSNIIVTPGTFATINTAIKGPFGLTLSGGGKLYLTNFGSSFAGNINVDGAGTTLVHRQEGPTPQYNGVNSSQEFGRFDQASLGVSTTVRNINLTNGGEYKIINAGNNPEGNYKNIVIGTGGGTLNLAPGYLVQNLDDVGQIGSTLETFTKAGKGRLIITGATALSAQNPLQGVVNINGGMLSLDSVVGTPSRFLGIASTGTTVNVNNGGTLFLNSGTQSQFDIPSLNLNDGSILGINGNNHIIGLLAPAPGTTTTTVSGTATVAVRDLFAVQTARFIFMRTALAGTGTLNLIGNTAAGGTPRLVIERGSESTFSGTFRLNDNMSLEANPRQNPTANTGKVMADGDVQFDGWAGTLDIRDSTAAATAFDYTTNEVTITTTQAGAVNTISPGRGDTAAGTANLVNLGTLTMGNHRLAIAGNNSYQTGFADTAMMKGNGVLIMNADNGFAVFSNAASISEDAAGRSLTILKTGVGSTVNRDVIDGGAISLSNLTVATGSLVLRGPNGAITTGFGGAAPTITVNGSGLPGNGSNLPTQGLLHLDSNGNHAVGATALITAGNQVANDRIADSATLNLRGNSIVRMTSANNLQTTETIGTSNVFGHGTFDLVKSGTPTAPVALTINTLTLGQNATANFTGAGLGTMGANSTRIVIGSQGAGFMSPAFHQANEWAKYDTTLDSGVAIGVTPFATADYTISTTEDTWIAGQQIKQTATAITLTGSRTADRFNFQPTATSTLNVGGFVLTTAQGGIISSGSTQGFKDGATGAAPSGTAGITAGTTSAPSSLFVQANGTVEFHLPIVNNAAGGPVTFVKSGTGTVVLSHQDRGVAAGGGTTVFTTPTWSSTNTGGWVINDGMLNVHRGQYLGATPTTITLNGGQLEINEPVSLANDATILPGWGHHIVVNGNAMVGNDDNGEAGDASTGDRTLVKLGLLTVNNGSILGLASFSDNDIAFMGGATFNGKATLSIGAAGSRSGVNNANIISGVLAGSGFDVLALSGGSTLVLGGTQSDTVNNTYDGTVTIYGATVRLNKANGFTAITDGAASEDVIINGGSLLWGPGQHGDLSTTNQAGISTPTAPIQGTNNFGLLGIAPTSPAAIKNAGMNQIADTASITLLTGTLGESDRITNEKFGTLTQKGGTFNVGLGAIEITNATISAGAVNIDRSGSLKVGTLTLLPGSPDMNVTTGLPVPGSSSTLEIGAGGVSLSGQNIILGTGSSGNVAGSGGVLKLGGNVTVVGSDLLGGSYGRKGIYIQTGSSFRELGNSKVDLLGGTRDFNVETNAIFTVTAPLTNGGISKSGNGALVLEPYQTSNFAGPIIVNSGVLQAKGDGALGTNAGGVTINSGGTVKLDSSWTYGGNFTVAGPGSLLAGDNIAREVGALVAEIGTIRLTGAVALSGAATLAGDAAIDPSVAPGAGGLPLRIGTLRIEGAGGITGTGNLTLSGNGDGVILNGVNLTSGNLIKDGAGRWTISNASSYTGSTTVTAGALRISNDTALGTTAGGTTVLGGSLELLGGISVAEPLTLFGAGANTQSGAVVNVGGSNTISGAIVASRAGVTVRSNGGTLTLSGAVTGTDTLTLSGQGAGVVSGGLALGAGGLNKTGSGTWTLSGGNSYTGATTVGGGTLVLNYGTNNTSKLSSTSPLNFGGGSLAVIGSSAAATSQTVGGVNFNAGGATVTVTNGAGRNATLALGPINRTVGGTVNFIPPAAGSITTTTLNLNGILGGYATVGGQNWATNTGGAIGAFSAYQPLSTGSINPDNNNSQLVGFQTQVDNVTTNSLKIGNASGVNLDFFNLTLNSGGVLFNGSTFGAITGTGTVSGATPEDELFINTSGGTLEVTTPLIGFGLGSLTKAGAGKLYLSGNSQFSGSVNINEGTLSIVGPGGTTHPNALGNASGPRNLNINGGTFEVIGGNYDSGATNMFYVIGPAGGTVRSTLGSTIIINDGLGGTAQSPYQLSGTGDLTFTGGGRYTLTGGAPSFPNFFGNVIVDGGILSVGNNNTTTTNVLGGRAEQTITLKPGSAIINNAGFGLGANGLPNNIIVPNGGVEFFGLSGSRVYAGDIQLSGTNTIALLERDNPVSERQIFFNGRVSGTNVTLNVFGIRADAAQPFYLASGANDLTGTINLNTNAVLEARVPGSLGLNTGDVTVNLAGNNSRLLLRHYQNGDYRSNVVVNAPTAAEINSDRLVNFGGGANQLLTINNLTSNTNGILTFNGGNGYATRVAGTVTLNANTIINTINANALLENGITFANGANTLEKRGAGVSLILRGPSNHSGPTIVQAGFLILQGNGAMPNTSAIVLRGGELRIENSDVVNTNRVNDAAPITLGGGALRITGNETIGTVTAVGGTTIVTNNPFSETVPNPLTLNGFTRAVGSVVQFQSDIGTVGQNTNASARVGARIFIPGQADTTQTIPGFLANNSLDFIQYNGTTLDNGFALGVQEMRNPGTATSPQNYTNDPAETAWNDSVIARLTNGTDTTTVTTTMTTNRALDAIKVETGGTARIREIATGGFQLRIEGGGIVDVSATTHTFNVTGAGSLTAGPATPGANVAELFLGGTGVMNINTPVVNNGTQPVALVKTGTGQVNLNTPPVPPAGTTAYSGGTYVTQGTLNILTNSALGAATNPITLSGGTLQFNIADAQAAGTGGSLGGLGQSINVTANSLIVLDNGVGPNTDTDIAFGGLTINGGTTLGIRGFDSLDATFTGTHTFSGTPTIDLPQAGSGSNPNTAATASLITLSGPITGSGFYVTSSGNTNDTTARLQIGGGASDVAPNTYTGKVILMPGSNNEDLFVELNKPDGITAITGDLELNGGKIIPNFSNQIADSSNVTLNWGGIDFNGKNETVASITQNGGFVRTNFDGTAISNNTVTVTGDYNFTGADDFNAVAGSNFTSNGLDVGSNSTLVVGGKLRMNGYSRATVAAASNLIVGGLEMTGTTLTENGSNSLIRLNGDVTTFASSNIARLGNTTAAGAIIELNGTRTFNVALGSAGLDLSVSAGLVDSTVPASVGGFVKTGAGTVQLEGSSNGNDYTGPTNINEGTVVLFKNVGINALGAGVGAVTVGDGIGGPKADRLIIRNSEQLNDSTNLTVASSGVVDLKTFSTNESINSLAGSGSVELGATSTLTVIGANNTVYDGAIEGTGGITKSGTGTLNLNGANNYLGRTSVDGGTLAVRGSIGGIATLPGATLSPGAGAAGLNVRGNFDLQSGAILKIELGGTIAGTSYDQINVTGGITLAGDLQGSLIDGFTGSSDFFYIIVNDGTDPVNGTFNGLAEGSFVNFSGKQFQIFYSANSETGLKTGGNDVLIVVPEPTAVASLLLGLGSMLGFNRFRRRKD